jgi:hypothetical protein
MRALQARRFAIDGLTLSEIDHPGTTPWRDPGAARRQPELP